jgi:hypothetical protein
MVPNARRPKREPDFSVRKLQDVQSVVEQLNGVSYR